MLAGVKPQLRDMEQNTREGETLDSNTPFQSKPFTKIQVLWEALTHLHATELGSVAKNKVVTAQRTSGEAAESHAKWPARACVPWQSCGAVRVSLPNLIKHYQ